jgi:signal transduction histidine kinase
LSERGRSDDALSNRDDFLGMVSHDLRDLVGAIVVTTGLLAKRAAAETEGPQVLALTERIQRYAARMNRLIGDLVDVTSIDAGKLAVNATHGDAALLIDEVVETFQAAAIARRITLNAEVLERPLMAQFDHGRLLQVLANLIANAIKFTPEGGQVLVSGERVEAGIRFCVSDSGPGIAAPMLGAVFERYRQAEEGDRRGLGLGLYISKCIVETHGGTIWAESEGRRGTRVCFVVPVTRSAAI